MCNNSLLLSNLTSFFASDKSDVYNVLNVFLQRWCEHQDSLDRSDRPADDAAQSKHDLAEYLTRQLRRMNVAILCENQPTTLMAQTNDSHRRGYFLLTPQKSSKALMRRAELADMLRDCGIGATGEPGFTLVEQAIRREKVSEWQSRVRAIPKKGTDARKV